MIRIGSIIAMLVALASALAGCSSSIAAGTSAGLDLPSYQAAATKPKSTRPMLVAQSGDYFRWEMPRGWKADETSNGVDMTSPDGHMTASSAVLMGGQGTTDPWSFLAWALGASGCKNLERISAENLPSQPSGYPGIGYEVKAFVIRFTDKDGAARRAECTVGICNAYGSFSAAFQMYATPPDEFAKGKNWLPMLTDSVRPIDASRVGNQNTVLLPRNHPLDDSSIMESWQARRDSQDRIAQGQHESTMGYERMVSPTDGTAYNMPYEAYDATVGGYRDPADRTQILKHAPPGH